MNFLLTTALLTALVLPAPLVCQNTRPRATPQTQASTPAAIGGNTPATNSKPSNAITAPSGKASQHPVRRRRRAQAPAADSSMHVIGSYSANQNTQNDIRIDSAALPGVPVLHNTLGIAAGTPITVRLQKTVTSGQAANGETVHGVLAQPLGSLPSGTPVDLTVVAAAKAGVIGSGGVLSLQVTRINGEQFLSQVITAQGKEGKKLVADDAPAIGSEAVFSIDQPITLPAA